MNIPTTSIQTFAALVPEIILVATATIIYLAGAFFPGKSRPTVLALIGLIAAAGFMLCDDQRAETFTKTLPALFTGPLAVDLFGHSARWFIVIAGAVLLLLSHRAADDEQGPEYTGSVVMMLAGLMLISAADELVLLFVGLELVSIPTYIILYVGRRGAASQEATTKYFFLSILSSALLLYGFSFLYGLAGSTYLPNIARALQSQFAISSAVSPLAAVALLLIFAGLGFRMTAVPFHFYAPDVYQGTTNANAGLLATLTKIAGLLVLARIVVGSMPGVESLGWKVMLAVAVLTMTLGNAVALWQSNIRRLVAYSSIAHGGYILIGVAVGLAQLTLARDDVSQPAQAINGLGTSLFYLATYVLATLGVFAALVYLESNGQPAENVDDLAGLAKSHPFASVCLAVFMFSLAGIPPLAGFWGKFSLMSGTLDVGAPFSDSRQQLQTWFLALAIITMLNAAMAAAYYLRIVAVMYFRPATKEYPATGGGYAPRLAMVLSVLLVIGVGILPGWVMNTADQAGISVRSTKSSGGTATSLSADGLPAGAAPIANGPAATVNVVQAVSPTRESDR
ncbi:MAG: NADH-quinone oxidoreductase subunit N [Planctomycetota bacterium]|nr:NADH-quinone oxidoreductase subunit N [Planctomycetota bacterium]